VSQFLASTGLFHRQSLSSGVLLQSLLLSPVVAWKLQDRNVPCDRVSPTVERRDARASSEQLWNPPDVVVVAFVNASVRSDATVSL
jgi:hypothetical protein